MIQRLSQDRFLIAVKLSELLRVPNLLGIRLFALLLGQNSVATNAMFDNRGTAILLAMRLVFVVR